MARPCRDRFADEGEADLTAYQPALRDAAAPANPAAASWPRRR